MDKENNCVNRMGYCGVVYPLIQRLREFVVHCSDSYLFYVCFFDIETRSVSLTLRLAIANPYIHINGPHKHTLCFPLSPELDLSCKRKSMHKIRV